MPQIHACFGGLSGVSVRRSDISEQIGKLRKGCDVIIGTPRRVIELLCINGGRLLDIKYVSYVVLDGAIFLSLSAHARASMLCSVNYATVAILC